MTDILSDQVVHAVHSRYNLEGYLPTSKPHTWITQPNLLVLYKSLRSRNYVAILL